MGRGKKKRPALAILGEEPTPELMARGEFRQGGVWATGANERSGLAYRRVPVIDTLFNANQLTASEYDALTYYRDQALRAEDDTAEDGTLAPARIMGGGGGAPGSRIPAKLVFTPAIAETGRIERELGALLDIARAIAVDDLSLTQWCISKHGGRERYDGKGKFVAVVPINEKRHVEMARLELKMAARRISR
jgi:hypothetical protein